MHNIMLKIVVLSSLVISCRTTTPNAQSKISEDEATVVRLKQDDPAQLPTHLWSASRRQENATYLYLVGEYKTMRGDVNGGRNYFESAYNLDPNPFLAAKLIATEALSGADTDAATEAKKMVLLYPKSAPLHFLYGQVLTRSGALAEAIEEVNQAIKFDSENEAYYLFLADLHQLSKAPDKAIGVLKSYLKRNSSSAIALIRLAKLYLFTGEKKQALTVAQQAVELGNSNPELILIYALTLDANGKSEQAVLAYESLYRNNPDSGELIGRMIELYRSLGNFAQSLELLNELAKVPGANKVEVDIQRAILSWEMRKFQDAADILEALAKAEPEQDRLRYLAGIANERINQVDRAFYWLEAIKAESEFWSYARLRMAVMYVTAKKYDQALAQVSAIEKAAKDDADTYSFAAGVFAEKELYAEALAKVKEGYKKFPASNRLLFLQSVYHERLNQYDAAVAALRKVIELEPNNSAALNFLGYMFAERNENLDEAETLIKKALTIKPGDGYYMDSLAWVYYQKQQYEKAQGILLKARDIVPNEGVVDEHLGDVSLKLNNKAEALKYFEAALQKNLEPKEKKRVIEKRDSLQNSIPKT